MIITSKLKVIELFAGIGAWSKALTNLNIDFELVGFSEIDKYAIESYCAIHNVDKRKNLGDISEVDTNDIPDCDVICYSPPCQSWSAAGKQTGFEDQRGILFFDALRIIKNKQPKFALMENVKNLTSKKFESEFSEMLNELAKAGYKNYWKILNAKDYNIPQNRERVFIISIRNDVDIDFKFPQETKLTNKLMNYLEEDAQLPILHNIYGGFKENSARVFEKYSPAIRTAAGGGHIPSVMIKDATVAIIDDTYKNRETREYTEYSPTIRSGRSGFKVVVKENDKYKLLKENEEIINNKEYFLIRNMNTLEAFRLMGFIDEDYHKAREVLNETFYKGKDKSNTRLYKQAGNSIVVNVLEALLHNLLK